MSKTILDRGVKKATVLLYKTTGNVNWDNLNVMAYVPDQSLSEDLSRVGLVHPLSDLGCAPADTVLEYFDYGYVTALRIDKSVVTSTAIKQAAAAAIKNRLEELGDDEGLSRDERAGIELAIRGKLLDAAPLVSRYVPILIDTTSNRVYVFDTSERVVNIVLSRLSNALAGSIQFVNFVQMAAKASIPNVGVKLLEVLRLLHTSTGKDTDNSEAIFANTPNLTFGEGVKLSKLDGTAGNNAAFPRVDLTDASLIPLLERASYVDKLGLFLVHSRFDLEFHINAQLQFPKLALGSLLNGAGDQDESDVVAELRSTAMLVTDAMGAIMHNTSEFLCIPAKLV